METQVKTANSVFAKQAGSQSLPTEPVVKSGELFVNQTMKDVDGNDVIIPVSIGIYDTNQLTAQLEYHQGQIDDINAKLAALAAL